VERKASRISERNSEGVVTRGEEAAAV